MRPFWCQRDAVETLIWLLDAGRTHDPAAHAAICEQLAQVNSRWNAGIPRVAVKMATGTGKTNLMAMLGLWWTAKHPGRPVDFLVLTPGLTISRAQRSHCTCWSSVSASATSPTRSSRSSVRITKPASHRAAPTRAHGARPAEYVSNDVWVAGTGRVPHGGPSTPSRARRRAGGYRLEASGMTALSRMTARLSALRAASGLGRRSMAASCA